MFVDVNDKTIVFTPKALDTLRDWLGEIEQDLGPYDPAKREAVSRVRALAQVLSSGFGNAARVSSDTPEGSLFVAEYGGMDSESASYVFGCVKHSDNQIGVHS